ncbi:hypothetical protein GCM10008967_38230 [Bacillus carboniphilus]|uniref:Uncharacterized protein n=1 Tax=Bacillus carboniphilus TaxID=86663 RepID=A0ABN0WQT8_9BACI
MFHLFFFGYTVHLLWSYIDIVLERYSILIHSYFIAPIFPYAINMTASAIPVAYLLLYQHCINHNKNFFIYSLFLGAIIAFGLAPIEMFIGMMKMSKGMNLLFLFFIDVAIGYAAYFLTKLVSKMSRNELFQEKS